VCLLAFHAYFTGVLIFKGLTARRLSTSFGVKRLNIGLCKLCIISTECWDGVYMCMNLGDCVCVQVCRPICYKSKYARYL
jgi:hypothetical protein